MISNLGEPDTKKFPDIAPPEAPRPDPLALAVRYVRTTLIPTGLGAAVNTALSVGVFLRLLSGRHQAAPSIGPAT